MPKASFHSHTKNGLQIVCPNNNQEQEAMDDVVNKHNSDVVDKHVNVNRGFCELVIELPLS